jgi:DNA repair protein SbcD/Mre11
MRFVHTADWHLGRLFHGVHLTEDQAHILNQFVAFVKDGKPDVLLIAGDIYDRAVPPPEAVGLLDDVLSRLVLGLKVPVVLIAGNHDSPHRLGFGSRLFAGQRLHLFGSFSEEIAPVIIEDNAGPVYI